MTLKNRLATLETAMGPPFINDVRTASLRDLCLAIAHAFTVEELETCCEAQGETNDFLGLVEMIREQVPSFGVDYERA